MVTAAAPVADFPGWGVPYQIGTFSVIAKCG